MGDMADMSDMSTMTALHSVPLEADKKVSFAPGGYHLMLVGLKAPLHAGEHVMLTLHFDHGHDQRANVEVRD